MARSSSAGARLSIEARDGGSVPQVCLVSCSLLPHAFLEEVVYLRSRFSVRVHRDVEGEPNEQIVLATLADNHELLGFRERLRSTTAEIERGTKSANNFVRDARGSHAPDVARNEREVIVESTIGVLGEVRDQQEFAA